MPEKLRILVIGADAEDRAAIRRALARDFPGSDVFEAGDPDAFEGMLSRPRVDIAITEHGSGWCDGVDVTARVKARHPEAGVIMFTSSGSEEVAVAAMKQGLDDYIAKAPGQVARLTAAVRTLSSQQGQRRRAQELERRFKTLFDHAPVGIFRVATDGRILDANPVLAQVLGARSPRELVGLSALGFYDDAKERARWLRELDAGREVSGFEIAMRRLDGSPIHVRLSARVIPSDDGVPEAYEGIIEDVSERHSAVERLREVERQLRHAQKMEALGRLAGGVAHDFNNLLTVILGHGSLLQDAIADGTATAADVEPILGAGRRATELTRQLLSLSHQHVAQPRIVDPRAVLDELAPMLRRLLGEDVKIAFDAAENCWLTRIDPAQLAQVVMNLALNARDAMPAGGTFSVRLANVALGATEAESYTGLRAGDHVGIVVSDTGHGISEDVRAHIFEPLFTTKDGPGAGLGLPVVRGIVRQWGGDLRVDSTPGHGTSFQILLPRAVPVERSPASERPPGVAAGGTETILVAEDDDSLRELIGRSLRAAGYEMLLARDGPEALRLASDHPKQVDLLLSDVVMPSMTGPELAERLRSRRGPLRVVLMTGYAGELARKNLALPASVAWLPKPFTPSALGRAVREALDAPATPPSPPS